MENETAKKKKWEFEDYAFTVTGIIVGLLLVLPEVLYSAFDISILGGSLGGGEASRVGEELIEDIEAGGIRRFDIIRLRVLSPMLFLVTTTICYLHDTIVARKRGGYKGSLFTHTFRSLLEDTIYMGITTAMVCWAVFFGAMYISWLAGPITWILFMFIFPLVRRKTDEEAPKPWLLLGFFVIGVVVEIFTGAWIAFPLAWLVICAFKLVSEIRGYDRTVDRFFDILYYASSVVLMGVGIALDFWIASWAAFPVAFFICWILNKFIKFRVSEIDSCESDS